MRKPIGLYAVGIGYLAAALATLVEGIWLADELYPHHYLFMILYPLVAYGVFKVRRWGWYMLIGHIGFLFVSNILMWNWLGDLRPRLLFELNLLLLFFLWYFLRRSVRSPFHNPALRWWERQTPRFGAVFAATLKRNGEDVMNGEGINISAGGCFVKLQGAVELVLHDELDIELMYENFDTFKTRCQVMWLAEPDSGNPRGAGIQFVSTDRVNRSLLKGIISVAKSRWLRSGRTEGKQ